MIVIIINGIRVRSNSISLFRLLVAERSALLRYLRSLVGSDEAEDVAQALYLKIRAIDDHRPIANKRAFLYRMAHNVAVDAFRSAKSRASRFSSEEDILAQAPFPAPSAETVLLDREALARLTAALSELSPRCQEIVRMHRVEGIPMGEVAEKLGISRQMVGRYVAQAMTHCHARMEDENWIPPVSDRNDNPSDNGHNADQGTEK
ncbi:RNA polymerase sigma factor [Novosphingobium sp. BL-8A]|uniref:RNA polymerase sigma factor n=1 Tax=Novosphingobium sp. BL-8A TaxID=3127639 RepID=UPI0037573F5A